jgi:general secretion pathway protein C
MLSRLAAFVIWAAIAASMVFWAMRLWVKPIAAPGHATLVSTTSAAKGDLSRLFGPDAAPAVAAAATPAPVQADARFKLIGVVAPRLAAARGEGLALIALDGKPPRAYRVGTAVDGDLVLQTVHARGVSIGPRGQAAQVDLELPALPPPATGTPISVGAAPQLQPQLQSQPARALPNRPLAMPAPAPVEQPGGAPPPPEAQDRPADEPAPQRPAYTPAGSPGRIRPPV